MARALLAKHSRPAASIGIGIVSSLVLTMPATAHETWLLPSTFAGPAGARIELQPAA